jgi:hypothetical protein
MTESLSPDIEGKIAQAFSAESLNVVSRSLASYQGSERNRVLRCILHLAGDDPLKISRFVDAAVQDYRDVIYWAEYDTDDHKVRDFNQPFREI